MAFFWPSATLKVVNKIMSPIFNRNFHAESHFHYGGLLLSENQGVESVLHFDVTTFKYKLDWI